LWPEFAGLTNANMLTAFNDAQLLLDNTCGSAVQDANKRLILLYTLTAHVCAIDFGTNDGAGNVTPPQGIVGRVANAAEGSVSVSAEYSSEVSQSEAYYIQTKYGAKFWQQTMAYRMAFYTAAPSYGPNGPGFSFFDDGVG
jgi:hypothetical protein